MRPTCRVSPTIMIINSGSFAPPSTPPLTSFTLRSSIVVILQPFFAPLQAKVNNQGQIGLSYQQDLRSGVKLTLSGLVEGRNINAGGHKLGVSLDFES